MQVNMDMLHTDLNILQFILTYRKIYFYLGTEMCILVDSIHVHLGFWVFFIATDHRETSCSKNGPRQRFL